MLRSVLSIFSGVVLGSLLVFAIEFLAHNLYPLPDDIGKQDLESLSTWINDISPIVLVLILLAHIVGTFGGALISALMANKNQWIIGSVVGGIMFVIGVVNVLFIKHPIWFVVADLSIYFPAALTGVYISYKLKNVV